LALGTGRSITGPVGDCWQAVNGVAGDAERVLLGKKKAEGIARPGLLLAAAPGGK
jgi:hypothetical protein